MAQTCRAKAALFVAACILPSVSRRLAKLGDLIWAGAARNVFIAIEHLIQEEIDEIHAKCEAEARAAMAVSHAEAAANGKAAKEATS